MDGITNTASAIPNRGQIASFDSNRNVITLSLAQIETKCSVSFLQNLAFQWQAYHPVSSRLGTRISLGTSRPS
jgi:hypothetical protein